MKKIFASLLFLFLVAISSNSFAQTAPGCTGTLACDTLTTQASCEASGACNWTASSSSCSHGTITTCSALSNNVCKTAPGCTLNVAGDANNNAFVQTMCNALKIVTGGGGKAFAAFAIISVGIGFFTGKVSWGLMIGITAGIAAMFGAPTIVAAISGESALDCSS